MPLPFCLAASHRLRGCFSMSVGDYSDRCVGISVLNCRNDGRARASEPPRPILIDPVFALAQHLSYRRMGIKTARGGNGMRTRQFCITVIALGTGLVCPGPVAATF